jgi:hypothetical protein
MQPEMYAQAYRAVYTFIKQYDPTARVANASMVQVTPGRLQYLDKVWNAYQQYYREPWPVDVWNTHLYILPELLPNGSAPNGISGIAVGTDPALGIRESGGDKNRCADPNVYCFAEHDDINEFARQVVAMRTWMKAHGQQDKPLILSEYSLLYPYDVDNDPPGCWVRDEYGNCFTPTRVRDFMNRSMDYMESAADPALGYPRDGNRLVQRWLWFSLYFTGAGAASSLLDSSEQNLSLPGQTYQVRAGAAGRTFNLYPATTNARVLPVPGAPSTLNATLTATIRNAGTVNTTGNVSVTFYANAGLTQPIGTVAITNPLRGCDGSTSQVSMTWANLPRGKRDYWVVVDPGNGWAETNEGDNAIKGTVFVGSKWTFLPNTLR